LDIEVEVLDENGDGWYLLRILIGSQTVPKEAAILSERLLALNEEWTKQMQ